MPDALPLYVFVATPGDVTTERTLISTCIDEHNSRQGATGVKFKMVGWESVRGTARRPQEAINELIGESHYLITMFKESWGSEPGSPWGFTSGTEEELFTGLLELGRPEQPMRDVWVAFLPAASPDPRIKLLRDQMAGTHAMMYEVPSDLRDLKSKIADRLEGWAATATARKTARHVELLPTSGKDILRAANLRRDGEKLVELGQPGTGGAKLKEAAAIGGPPEQLAYAKFLERRGDLDDARLVIQRAIDYFATGPGVLHSALAAEAFSADARILRRQGDEIGAIGRLQHALTLLVDSDPFSTRVKSRILDDLGIAYLATKDYDSALKEFETAHELRNQQGDTVEISQSLVNIARVHGRAGEHVVAEEFAKKALIGLREVPPDTLRANAEILVAQTLLRLGRATEAIENAERAVAINQQIGNRQGEAIAHLVAAQCCRSSGRNDKAKFHAQNCLELNKAMGNKYGQDRARWLLDQIGN
ncbi:tetratricopeptide (TPR) repeat protein [Mycobacterium sp. OAS707]|uniref:tetratricopeptide repeat protein n=1 Tax=Mycobacterium sp. OAS707 TaxID=2663822 RepID=UPI00178BA32F|nr:tetratricopeptide repeat protein [Mycobacterium sp. OAS707]MBE1548967.1 tetratricopeptide (TPR) repeat protein [Mycobacterium sp. OAS707]